MNLFKKHRGKRPYVAMPNFFQLQDKKLKYLDVLTYVSLKSFHNIQNDSCFPMHETIAKNAGMSKNFVIASIKRLEEAKMIIVDRPPEKHVSNQYKFPSEKKESKHKVPYELFKISDLTSNEKAMLICLRQLFYHGKYCCTFTIAEFSVFLGVSYQTIVKQYKSLVKKGYLNEKRVIFQNQDTDVIRIYLTAKLDWDYDIYEAEAVAALMGLRIS